LEALLIADITKLFRRLWGWDFQLEDRALLILGTGLLLLVPKYYIEMKEEETKTTYGYYYPGSGKAVWILLSLGLVCIVVFLYELLV
jgi:hypothetical protein